MRVLGVPWPLSEAVMRPTWAFSSPEAVGVIICYGARVRLCVRASRFLCSCLRRAHRLAVLNVPKHDVLMLWLQTGWNAYPVNPIYPCLWLCDLYVAPKHTQIHTHTFSLEPRFEEGGSGNLWGGAWLGEEAKEPSLTWGMGPEGTKPHSLLRHVENGKRARGGGERSKKKWRKKEEGATISGIC